MLVAALLLAPTDPLRVLFVGDSFTYFNNLPAIVQEIANATPGTRIDARRVTHGAWNLDQHWRAGTALARIRQGGWNVVVLQEEGALPVADPGRFQADVRRFAHEIRLVHAEPLLLATWAPRDKPWLQGPLSNATRRVGRSLRVPVAPVGDAWRRWLADPHAPPLHIGDAVHPDFRGSYLSALVLVRTLRGRALATAPTDFTNRLGVAHPADGKPVDTRVDLAELPRLLRCVRWLKGS